MFLVVGIVILLAAGVALMLAERRGGGVVSVLAVGGIAVALNVLWVDLGLGGLLLRLPVVLGVTVVLVWIAQHQPGTE